uniref:hypothetical protein n=1 Tax=Escherichia coli TaxID=562 RepID=UPI0013C314AD
MIETDRVELQSFEKAKGIPLHFSALIDGQHFSYSTEYEQTVENGIAKGIIDIRAGFDSEPAEQSKLELNVREISGIEGTWNFTLPINNEKVEAMT